MRLVTCWSRCETSERFCARVRTVRTAPTLGRLDARSHRMCMTLIGAQQHGIDTLRGGSPKGDTLPSPGVTLRTCPGLAQRAAWGSTDFQNLIQILCVVVHSNLLPIEARGAAVWETTWREKQSLCVWHHWGCEGSASVTVDQTADSKFRKNFMSVFGDGTRDFASCVCYGGVDYTWCD